MDDDLQKRMEEAEREAQERDRRRGGVQIGRARGIARVEKIERRHQRGMGMDLSGSGHGELMSAMSQFENPEPDPSKKYIKNDDVMRGKLEAKAKAAHDLLRISQDQSLPPSVREEAQREVAKHKIDQWVQVHKQTQDYWAVSQLLQSYTDSGSKKISREEFDRRFQELQDGGLDVGAKLTVMNYLEFEQIRDNALRNAPPEKDKMSIKLDDGTDRVLRVSRSSQDIKDIDGSDYARLAIGDDPRGIGLAAKNAQKFLVDGMGTTDIENGRAIQSAQKNASKLVKDAYSNLFAGIEDLDPARHRVLTQPPRSRGIALTD